MTDSRFPMCEKLGLTIATLLKESYAEWLSKDTDKPYYFQNFDKVVKAEDLEKLLSQAVRVYGIDDWIWDQKINHKRDTHQALLIAIEELPKEKCKHQIIEYKNHGQPVTLGRCGQCGVKLKAEWKEASE